MVKAKTYYVIHQYDGIVWEGVATDRWEAIRCWLVEVAYGEDALYFNREELKYWFEHEQDYGKVVITTKDPRSKYKR